MMHKILLSLLLQCVSISLFAQFNIGETTLQLTDANRSDRVIETRCYFPIDEYGSLADGIFPVLAFGHGFLMDVDSYENMRDSLVPQGYILALPTTEISVAPSHGDFGQDLAFIVDYFLDENENTDSFLYQKVAPKAAVMGHSMGGGAAFLATAFSENIGALVGFAPAETNPSAIAAAANVSVPSLIFAGSGDCVTPPETNQQPMYDAIVDVDFKQMVTVVDGSHCAFSSGNAVCELGETFSACGAILDNQDDFVFPYLQAFLGAALKNKCGTWNDFQENGSNEATLAAGTNVQSEGEFVFDLPVPVLDFYYSAFLLTVVETTDSPTPDFYVWSRDGVEIPNENSSVFNIPYIPYPESGVYSVVGVYDGCASEPVEILIIFMNIESITAEISAFYSPETQQLFLETATINGNFEMQLFDVQGKTILPKKEMNASQNTIQLPELTTGIYVGILNSNEKTYRIKFFVE